MKLLSRYREDLVVSEVFEVSEVSEVSEGLENVHSIKKIENIVLSGISLKGWKKNMFFRFDVEAEAEAEADPPIMLKKRKWIL